MTTKIFKDKCRMTVTEYEFRQIDECGDATDTDHFDTKAEALAAAVAHIARGGIAGVVEKHVMHYPAHMFEEPQTFTMLAVFGDKSALELWGRDG